MGNSDHFIDAQAGTQKLTILDFTAPSETARIAVTISFRRGQGPVHLDRPNIPDVIGYRLCLGRKRDLTGLVVRHFHTFAHTAKTA